MYNISMLCRRWTATTDFNKMVLASRKSTGDIVVDVILNIGKLILAD